MRFVVPFLLFLFPAPAAADVGMQVSKLPLWKAIEQPFFSLDGSHVELGSLLFLFISSAIWSRSSRCWCFSISCSPASACSA